MQGYIKKQKFLPPYERRLLNFSYLCKRQGLKSIEMSDKKHDDLVCEPAAVTYGMSDELRSSSLLSEVGRLSRKDKECLVKYIFETEETELEAFDAFNDDLQPYTIEELNARIDEAEDEMERGEGKSFQEMMEGFKKELLWLR